MVRSVTAAAVAAATAHIILAFIPDSFHIFNMMQSSVALLALASLAVLVVTHHRRDGQLLTQLQEEMILVGAFGLFWFAVLVAFRASRQGGGTSSGAEVGLQRAAQSGRQAGRSEPQSAGGRRPYPCSSDSYYCVVEEYGWY